MSIRLLLVLTAAVASTIAITRLFRVGNGIPGVTLPAFLIGESIWIGTFVICLATARNDRLAKGKPMNAVVGLVLTLALMGILIIQIWITFSLLLGFGLSISG